MLHYACTSTLVTCYIGLLPVDDCVTFPQVIDTRDELVKALVGRHNVHLYVRMSVIPSPSVFFLRVPAVTGLAFINPWFL